jgi:hypothetical protein
LSDFTESGDALIERILTVGDVDGKASNDLIAEFYTHGYPVNKLLPLLLSDKDETVRAGAFVAEELGAKAAPLLPELMLLLDHRDRRVRYDVLEAVLAAATRVDGEVIARAISLVRDEDPAVRAKALSFLARAHLEQISAGIRHVQDPVVREGLAWLVKVEESASDEDVASRLVHSDRLVRWFAGSAAVRAYRRNDALLAYAVESDDAELRAFAESQQRRFQRERSRQ